MKRIGEDDIVPFATACKRDHPTVEANARAEALCSVWQDYLSDASWYPFKPIEDEFGNRKVYIIYKTNQPYPTISS